MAKMKHDDAKQDKPMMVGMVHKHEKNMHSGKAPTKFAKGGTVTRGNGAAQRGTKARGPMA